MSSNSVFINYRRSVSAYLAQLVWRELTDAGIDAFYDIASIDAGQFDQIILNQIAARPYFMPILSPGCLERCQDPGDWVLREMQEALRLKRVIVPLVTEEFSFADFDKYLPPDLASVLRHANAMPVPPRWFKYAIAEVRDRFLRPIDLPTTPAPQSDAPIVAQKQAAAAAQPEVADTLLEAQEHLGKGITWKNSGDFEGAIAEYSEAIRLNPNLAEAYARRGGCYINLENKVAAMQDLVLALRLDPKNTSAYINRGILRLDKGDVRDAITDFTEAIQLEPNYALGYLNRGIALNRIGDIDGAIADYTQAIQLNPQSELAYLNRGIAFGQKGEIEAEIADYSEVIRLNPSHVMAFAYRGTTYEQQSDLQNAAADYLRVLELQPYNPQAQAMREFIQKYG